MTFPEDVPAAADHPAPAAHPAQVSHPAQADHRAQGAGPAPAAGPSQTAHPGLHLAASWYAALPSRELSGRGPKEVRLFGRRLVAWRDGGGRAVLMPRSCPHMGASLAGGKVVGGELRCPFHHWRFDGSGQCVAAPGVDRVPRTARVRAYPVLERHGYVWAWYGTQEPLFPLPELPALEAGGPRLRTFRFADTTNATVRRILENTYDPDHLVALHGLRVAGPLALRMLDGPGDTPDHGPPIAAEAWLGAELGWPHYTGKLGAVARLLGTEARRYALRVDGWPGGQRISYFADGELQYRLLLAATPLAPNRTVQHIAVAVENRGRFWPDLLRYWVNRLEIGVASDQDLPVFNTIEPGDRHGIYLERDRGVLKFRKYYQSWVDRVTDHA